MAGCGEPGIAAKLADNYSLNGFDDWFLPTQDQPDAMYAQKARLGLFQSTNYWSSSQIDANQAWTQNFVDGTQNAQGKDILLGVRAVRSFNSGE